jgi:hypothetical protein
LSGCKLPGNLVQGEAAHAAVVGGSAFGLGRFDFLYAFGKAVIWVLRLGILEEHACFLQVVVLATANHAVQVEIGVDRTVLILVDDRSDASTPGQGSRRRSRDRSIFHGRKYLPAETGAV